MKQYIEKKRYEKPAMLVVELQHYAHLLQASRKTPPEEIKDYDDWMG